MRTQDRCMTLRSEADAAPTQRLGATSRNVLLMVVTFAANSLASFATFPYLTRVLGPAHFGMLAYAMAMATYGTLFTEWGFNLSGPRAVAESGGEQAELNSLVWSIVGAKSCLCVVSFVVVLLIMALDRQIAAPAPVVLLSWLSVVANVLTLYWLFQGLERFHVIAAMVFVNRLVTLPLTFLLVRTPDDVAIAAAIQAAGPVFGALLSILMARRLGILGRPNASWRAIRARMSAGVDLFVSTASVTLFGAANTVILGSLTGPYQVGLYAAADKIRIVGNLVPTQLCSVLFPRVSQLVKSDPVAAARLTVIGALVVVAASVCSVALFSLLSEPVTRVILGASFEGSSSILVILCLSTLFGNLAYFLGLQVLVPSGFGKGRSTVMVGAGLLNIAATFALVPRFGARGAAMAFLVAEAAIFVAYMVFICGQPRLLAYFKAAMRR
jgi:O-antigen/teichoic acid export membrane protein